MGSAQSYVTTEAALTAALVASAIGIGYTQMQRDSGSTPSTSVAGGTSSGKKGKKTKKAEVSSLGPSTAESASRSIPPAVIPGGFDTPTVSTPTPAVVEAPPPKSKKSKKKKKGRVTSASASAAAPGATTTTVPDTSSAGGYQSDSSAEHPQPKVKHAQKPSSSSSQPSRAPPFQSALSVDTDSSWTRVSSARRKQRTAGAASTSEGPSGPSADPTSDAGVTTSVTGNSSPVAERTEDEGLGYDTRESFQTRRPLAERLLPKPRKTGVDDMLETSDYPTISRVMRVQPLPDEKPASGFSWDDYEDVHVGEGIGGGNEADGEDDGWGVVRSKTRSNRPVSSQVPVQKAPESLTKRQRQNASKKEAQKAAKAQVETERLATLAKHKRNLEQAKMAEQWGAKGGKGKTASGGMKAVVDEGGKLVWE